MLARFALKLSLKLIYVILSLLALSLFVFVIAHFAIGDPLQAFYGDVIERMNEASLARARARLGLDEPLIYQYLNYLERLINGDLGISLRYRMPVSKVLDGLFLNTFILGFSSYLLVFLCATLIAIICALYEGRLIDKIICSTGTIFFYTPAFILSVILILIFAVNLQILPSFGAYDLGQKANLSNRLYHLILPLTVMILTHVWYYGYTFRNKLLEELRKEYVLSYKAKGLSNFEIVGIKCLRNILPTILNFMAISVPHILGGTYVVEAVFNYPGLGALAIDSAKNHDYNLLMCIVMLTGFLVIVSALLAKTLGEIADPRLKNALEVNHG